MAGRTTDVESVGGTERSLVESTAPQREIFIGLDVGGTYLKGARIDESGQVLERLHEPVERDSAEALLGQMAGAARRLEEPHRAASIGVGVPGIVNAGTGRVQNAPNLPLLNGLDVGAELSSRTGRFAVAENDANAAALGEAWLGAGRGARSVLFVTLGTGVGGGIVFEGRVWGGTSGYAGEIGHIQADPAGLRCGCGSWGCVETIAGTSGFVRRAQEAIATRESRLRRHRELNPEVIVNEAKGGDEVAIEIVDGAARALGVGVAAALNLLNLERVVIGGGVARAGSFLLDRIAAETQRRTFAHVSGDAVFRLAELGADEGVIGAARVGMIGAQTTHR